MMGGLALEQATNPERVELLLTTYPSALPQWQSHLNLNQVQITATYL